MIQQAIEEEHDSRGLTHRPQAIALQEPLL